MTYAHLDGGAREALEAALAGRSAGISVRTSGTTGTPRAVHLSADAVRWSASASVERLGGPGAWLLALPPERIGGAMVIARALLTDAPLVTHQDGPFTVESFVRATEGLPASGRRYTSLVPTQVHRLVQSTAGREALSAYDAVLVGGAPLHGDHGGAPLIPTYGMTETCGGCVYNGVPLDGVTARINADGRVLLRSPGLMDGYSDGANDAWVTWEGERYLLTPDLGHWDRDRLVVTGRADDVINSGGIKVYPDRVAQAVSQLIDSAPVVVVGVPDPDWGQRVVAVVESPTAQDCPAVDVLREQLTGVLEPAERPVAVIYTDMLPRLDSGKIDRAAIVTLATNGASLS